MKAPLLILLLAPALGCTPANPSLDPTPFIGTWRYARNEEAICKVGGGFNVNFGGKAIIIRPSADGGLELEASCHCLLKLRVEAGYRAVATGSQRCEQLQESEPAVAQIESLSIALQGTSSGTESATIAIGGVFDVQNRGIMFHCETRAPVSFTLNRTTPTAACGPEDTAVGVPATDSDNGLTDCPTEAGRDGVALFLDNEDTPAPGVCSNETANWREGAWVAPAAVKLPHPPCPADSIPDSFIPLCRVDGRLFRAMTADAARTENNYAVLKLGTSCPHGSIEMTKTISTESSATDKTFMRGHVGDGNRINTDPPHTVTLAFCYFTVAAAPEQPMTEFPDLGFPYAVFHDFDGPQPSWVLSKMWHQSDDEDTDNHDRTEPPANNGFDAIVDNVNNDTCLDLARVR